MARRQDDGMKYPRAFLVLCALGVLVILGSDLATPMIPLFAEELGASALEVGFIRSAYFMTRIFIELPVGLISDRIGRRKPIVLGLFLSALSAVICGSSPNIGQLIVGRAIWGVGAALYFASSTVLVLDMFQEDRGKALGIYQGVEFAGRFAGAPLGGALSEYFGFRVAFYATGAALLGGSALAMASKEFRDLDLGKTKSSHTRLLTSISLLRTWPIAVASMVGFLRTFNMQGITQTLIPLFQSGVLGFGPFDIGLLATTRTIGVVAMTLLGGYLTDRVGKKPVLITGIALSAVANACYLHYLSYLGQAVVGVVSGFGAGMMTVVLPIIVSEAVDASARGAAMGAYRTVFDIGSVTGPIVATMGLANIEDLEVSSVQLRFYVFAAVLAIGIPLVLTLRGPSRAADDPRRALASEA